MNEGREKHEGDSPLALVDLSSVAQNIFKHSSTSMTRGTDALSHLHWGESHENSQEMSFFTSKTQEMTFCMKKIKQFLFINVKYGAPHRTCREKKYVYRGHEYVSTFYSLLPLFE